MIRQGLVGIYELGFGQWHKPLKPLQPGQRDPEYYFIEQGGFGFRA